MKDSHLSLIFQQYVRGVFAQRLRQEGFSSINGNDLQWFRLVNQDVVNAIVFFTPWADVPVLPLIGYGIYPTFLNPYIPKKVHITDPNCGWELFTQHQLVESGDEPLMTQIYSKDVPVYCPGRDGKGIYTFDEILLPKMEQCQTPMHCYELHKQAYLSKTHYSIDQRFNFLSYEFIEEMIYFDDEEMYPYAQSAIVKELAAYQEMYAGSKMNKNQMKLIDRLSRLHHILFDGARKDYLDAFEKQKADTLRIFEKHGITT